MLGRESSFAITDLSSPEQFTLWSLRAALRATVRAPAVDCVCLDVHLVASNLFDEEYIQYDALTLGMAVLGAPRVLGVMLETKF